MPGIVSFGSHWPNGASQINLGQNDLAFGASGGALLNFAKTFSASTLGVGNDATLFDDYGYPLASLSGAYGSSWAIPPALCDSATVWCLKWPATRTFKITINVNVVLQTGAPYQKVNATTSGGAGTSMDITTQAGLAGKVYFTWVSAGSGSKGCFFPAGNFYAAGSGDIALVRASDEAAYDAGEQYTPEFISVLRGLNPKTIRPMGWANTNNTNEVKWAYRTTPNHISYTSPHFPLRAWGGTVTGTDTYTIPAASDTSLAGWVDGEVICGVVTNPPTKITASNSANNGSGLVRLTVSSTATLATNQIVWITGVAGTTEANGVQTITVVDSVTIDLQGVSFVHAWATPSGNAVIGTQKLTITGKSGGSKFIGEMAGYALFTQGNTDGWTSSGRFSTFVYDALLDKVLWQSSGVTSLVPIETQVFLANKIKANLWVNLPHFAADDYVSGIASYCRDNLYSYLGAYFEYSNEIWNFIFSQTSWSLNRGLAIGWGVASDQALHGWYGLRFAQMMTIITSLWGNRGGLTRVMAFKAFDSTANVDPFRFKGQSLHTSASWPNYAALGYADFSVGGNRPVDLCDSLAYATYYHGANVRDLDGNYLSASTAFLIALGNQYNSGDSVGAQAILDNDIRQGTTSVQTVTVGGDGKTFTIPGTNYASGQALLFTTSGSLFTGISANTCYFCINPSGSTFQVCATYNGSTAVTGISGGTGTQSVGALGFQTTLRLKSVIYPQWSDINISGSYNKRVEPYEGGEQCIAPSASRCTALSILCTPVGGGTATAAAASSAITGLISDYLNSDYGRAIVMSQFAEFDATPNSITPSWLSISGPSQWSMYPADIFSSAPFKTYAGFASFR